VSHDDHVDGLNHELGLLVTFGLLGALGETSGLGDGSSLGSEVSALHLGGLGHLLLVSGVLSELGVMDSSLFGSLTLEVGLSLLVSVSLLGFEGLHFSFVSKTFSDSSTLHVSVSDSLGMSSLSSSDGGHSLGVSSALLSHEHFLSLDEGSFTESSKVSHLLGMGFLSSSDFHTSLVSSDSLFVGSGSSKFGKVLFAFQGSGLLGSLDGKDSSLMGLNSSEVSSTGSSLSSSDSLGSLNSSHVFLMGDFLGSEGGSLSLGGLLLTEGSKLSGSSGSSLSSFDLKGKGSSSRNSEFVSSNTGKMGSVGSSSVSYSNGLMSVPGSSAVGVVTDVHVSSIMVSRVSSMVFGVPVAFSVNLRLAAVVPVIVDGDPRVFSHASSVVPSSIVSAISATGCDNVSFLVATEHGEGCSSSSLEPDSHVSGGEQNIVALFTSMRPVRELSGESVFTGMVILVVVTIFLSTESMISRGMPSGSSFDSTGENPSILSKASSMRMSHIALEVNIAEVFRTSSEAMGCGRSSKNGS